MIEMLTPTPDDALAMLLAALSRFGMAGKMSAEPHAVRELIRPRAREAG
ncbi:hypothetical protein [Nonomuraea sp. NPDC052265]